MFEFFGAFSRKRPELVEADIGDGFDIEISAGDFIKLNLHPFDDAGQTKAADRRREQAGIALPSNGASKTVTAQEAQ